LIEREQKQLTAILVLIGKKEDGIGGRGSQLGLKWS
jgi:hypothetical protein